MNWKNPWIYVGTFLIGLILFLAIYIPLQGFSNSNNQDVGIAFKVPYGSYPELQEIYDAFKKSCVIPDLPESYFEARKNNEVYQQMRNDCMDLPDEHKYEEFEMNSDQKSKESIKEFYDQPIENSKYFTRYGCLRTDISKDLEQFAAQKIASLSDRLGLMNKINRNTDSRGSTYMPPGGFMEYHSNQNHYGGWRFYMHYLPNPGKSIFAYKHPYDGTYRQVPDTNEGANMFRIRLKPKPLLWHCIFTEVPRFSWGIWLDPSLAQHLKEFAVRM